MVTSIQWECTEQCDKESSVPKSQRWAGPVLKMTKSGPALLLYCVHPAVFQLFLLPDPISSPTPPHPYYSSSLSLCLKLPHLKHVPCPKLFNPYDCQHSYTRTIAYLFLSKSKAKGRSQRKASCQGHQVPK